MIDESTINLVLRGIGGGSWEWDIDNGQEIWSDEFFHILGYERGEIEATFSTFIDYLVHPSQKELVNQRIKAHLEKRTAYDVEILLQTKTDGFKWFRSIGNAIFNADSVPTFMVGAIIDIHERRQKLDKVEHLTLLLEEVGDMARVGGWEVEIGNNTPIWSDEVYRIHEIPIGEPIDLDSAFAFFKPESQKRLMAAYQNTLQNKKPYDLNLELVTAQGKERWVRSICKPILDRYGVIRKLRGSFQDITEEVENKINAEKRRNLLAQQNNRLINFAHIISHNLRSHSGNLQLMSNLLLEESFSREDELEIMKNISKISSDLTITLEHLNEIVEVQTKVDHLLELVHFHDQVESVKAMLYLKIKESNAIIQEDFKVKSIKYVPAYIESIFQNLIGNGIKYRHPDRAPKIIIKSFKDEKGNVHLHFSDNGLGIDLERHKSKIFGLYKTFHRHEDSRGVGLFLTKNQIESLNGTIEVESTPGKGTTFKITF